jgi:tetratricopeptide (TPR) repeat protein
MEITKPWQLLRGAKADQEAGLTLIRQAYIEEPTSSRTMELGIGLLWTAQYDSAGEHFEEAIARERRHAGDGYFGFAGVARWCLGNYADAVSKWNQGLKAKYARAGGLGVKMPLLLFFASVIHPNLYDNAAAIQLIREKATDTRIHCWPGPIAQWILEQITEGELLNCCQGRHERDLRDNLWKFQFYKSLIKFGECGPTVFKEAMHKWSDSSQLEWQNEHFLLRRIWCEEFFLARYEGTKR